MKKPLLYSEKVSWTQVLKKAVKTPSFSLQVQISVLNNSVSLK